jgi:hypothetical protein
LPVGARTVPYALPEAEFDQRPEVTLRRRIRIALAIAFTFAVQPASAQQETGQAMPQFHGFLFGDVTFQASEQTTRDGFLIGQLVGHGNMGLSERLHLFVELSASARPTQYLFEAERAILRYDFTDLLKLSVGRYHTPVSYWNTQMHHGLWLQTSVGRPELVRIGGSFVPVHFIGAVAEGEIGGSALTFGYEAGIGNGRDQTISRGGDAGDINDQPAGVVAVRVRPSTPFGLQLGGSVYFDRIAAVDGAVRERIATAHIVWDRGAPELIAEYANVRHEPTFAAGDVTHHAWYVHAGYRLPGGVSRLKPYARVESVELDDVADVALGTLVGNYDGRLIGVRWDFETLATAKLEGRRERRAGGDWRNSLFVQFAFVVPSFEGM